MSLSSGPLGFPPLDPAQIARTTRASSLEDEESFLADAAPAPSVQPVTGVSPVALRAAPSHRGRTALLLVVALLLGAVVWPGTPLGPDASSHLAGAISRPVERVMARYLIGAVSDAIDAKDFATAEAQLTRLWAVADSGSSQPHLLRIRLDLARADRPSALAAIRAAATLTEDWKTDIRLVRLAKEAADPRLSADMAIQAFVRGADASSLPELAAAQQRAGNRQAAARILEFGIQIAPTRALRDSLVALHTSLRPTGSSPTQ